MPYTAFSGMGQGACIGQKKPPLNRLDKKTLRNPLVCLMDARALKKRLHKGGGGIT